MRLKNASLPIGSVRFDFDEDQIFQDEPLLQYPVNELGTSAASDTFRATGWSLIGTLVTVEARCKSGPSIATKVERIQARPRSPIWRPAVRAPTKVIPARQSV